MLVLPSVDYVVKDNEIVDGKCVGETVTLTGCDPLRCFESRCDNDYNCAEITSCEYDKLCEAVALLEDLDFDIDLPQAAGVTQVGCVKADPTDPKSESIGIVLVCKVEDPVTGDITYKKVMMPMDGGGLVDPYDGPFSDCGPVARTFTNECIGDPASPLCDKPIYTCEGTGEMQVLDTSTNPSTWISIPPETDLSQNSTAGKDLPTEQDKEDLTPYKITGPYPATPMADVFAEALALSAVTDFPDALKPIALEHVEKCGAAFAYEESGYNGVVINDLGPRATWNDFDGVNMLNTLSVPEGCCVVVNFCAVTDYVAPKGGVPVKG